jgi:hypothetical protein
MYKIIYANFFIQISVNTFVPAGAKTTTILPSSIQGCRQYFSGMLMNL